MRALVVTSLVLASAGLLASPVARAQPTPAGVAILVTGGEDTPERREAFRTHVERAALAAGLRDIGDPTRHATERARALGSLDRSRLETFRQVERLLVSARVDAAAFQEGRALASLAEAVRRAELRADVPGAAAWIAEVYTAMGITAAQAGLDDLMEASLSKAATLDSTRGVRAAEAPPTVVERAASILAAVATRPLGSFEVTSASEGARAFLDDQEVGELPRIIRAPVGTHVLRVEGPGQRPWGAVIDVLEGRRPAIEIALAPDPLVAAARRLVAASHAADFVEVEANRARLGVEAAWVVEVGDGPLDRALLVRCEEGGCDRPRRLELDEVLPRPASLAPEAVVGHLAAAREWVGEIPVVPPPREPEWWEQWYVWAGAGALLVGGVVTAVVVAEQRGPVLHQPDYGIHLPIPRME
jgi:hypothetical protein